MITNKVKNPAKRGFFYICALTHLLFVSIPNAVAESAGRTYWERLLHADNGISHVQTSEFFVAPKGNTNLDLERKTFENLLYTKEGKLIACQFPARYKWLKSQSKDLPSFDLETCTDLKIFFDAFQKRDFYIAYVSEYLDAPASAFGHLMLVFHDGKTPMELADTIHFAANTNHEGALLYAAKGISGGFEGEFIREAFFTKKKDYLLFEQRAIYLYKVNLSKDEIENIVLHLFELRKAKFKYYFIDENCAFQLAELINIASPSKNYRLSPGQPILPIDVVKLHADQVTELKTYAPTIIREKKLVQALNENEKEHVQAVVSQTEEISTLDSDQVKELLYLHYQYAFRRKRNPYPNHSEIEALDFKESTQSIELPDPRNRTKENLWTVGVQQFNGQMGARFRWTPLGEDKLKEQINHESRLNILESTLDMNNGAIQINKIKFISMRSTPNTLDMHHPWSWGMDVGMNRNNVQRRLSTKAEISAGKTWIFNKLRIEAWIAPGLEQNHESNGYVKPKLVISSLLTPDVLVSASTYKKQFIHEHYSSTELSLKFKNIQIQHQTTGTKESSILLNLPF